MNAEQIMSLHDKTIEWLQGSNAEAPALAWRLLALASPAAESLSDKQRIDEFVDAATEAAGEIIKAATKTAVPVAYRVITNNTKMSFYLTREEAEHGAKNRLTYVKGCTSAVVEPLYASPVAGPSISSAENDMLKALKQAKRLTDNMNEFGACTDSEIYDDAWAAIESAISKAEAQS